MKTSHLENSEAHIVQTAGKLDPKTCVFTALLLSSEIPCQRYSSSRLHSNVLHWVSRQANDSSSNVNATAWMKWSDVGHRGTRICGVDRAALYPTSCQYWFSEFETLSKVVRMLLLMIRRPSPRGLYLLMDSPWSVIKASESVCWLMTQSDCWVGPKQADDKDTQEGHRDTCKQEDGVKNRSWSTRKANVENRDEMWPFFD
jgi:hypothetical protein